MDKGGDQFTLTVMNIVEMVISELESGKTFWFTLFN